MTTITIPGKIQPADSRQRIIVTGYIVRRPVGGLAWHYLNYVIGLALLGHDVYYLEDSSDQAGCFDPTRQTPDSGKHKTKITFCNLHKSPDYGLKFSKELFSSVGLEDRWAYYDAHSETWCGPVAARVSEIYSSADILLNISNSVPMRDWFTNIPCRVLVDTDPVFTQISHIHVPSRLEQATLHTAFVTFGENFSQQQCSTPDDGFPWKATRQPFVMDYWPLTPGPTENRFTTIMSWDSYPPAIHNGERFGLKSDSFAPFLDLPCRTDALLEMAIECPAEIREKLEKHGWKLSDAIEVTRDSWTYRDYIQGSGGEFSIAKHAYAATRSGWFSERSVAYLASGRPVLTQETGFSDWLDTGYGVVPFSNIDEACEALNAIMENYDVHSRRAREIAVEYFDYRVVLPKLLEDVMEGNIPVDMADVSHMEILVEYHQLLDRLRTVIPENNSFILVDDNQWGQYGTVAERKCFPFLERDGLHWGNPADSEMAIGELERLRREGADFIVFAEPAFWWFDYYSGFLTYMNATYHEALKCTGMVVYDLNKTIESATD